MRSPSFLVLAGVLALGVADGAPTPPLAPDIPAKFDVPMRDADYERREVKIAMRDGVRLHTVVLVPRGARRAPMILTRTPYDANKRAQRSPSHLMAATVPMGDDQLVAAGYIRVFQDVRGKDHSEGDYVMTRPLRGPLNDSAVDHATDAFDTIDWLVKNVPESNGKVGMIGSSYEGFTVLMALVKPHPALKAAVPMCPMVDGWKGDDWFHWGAFRQVNFDYFIGQTSAKGDGKKVPRGGYDDYETFRRDGSAGDHARRTGVDQLPYWNKVTEHPTYDRYWQGQALDRILGDQPLVVPTMFVAAIWDQEDSYGAIATYQAVEPKDLRGDKSFLVLGPWRHSGQGYDMTSHGPLEFGADTSLAFRRDFMQPFLDANLKDGAPPANVPAVAAFETGTNTWRRLASWPPACVRGCAQGMTRLHLGAKGRATFDAPAAAADDFDEYVSDPAKPVPFVPRPVRMSDKDQWRTWLVHDQRAFADRPDVLVYVTEPLAAPVKIAGAPAVHLYASTTGSDADWVVKLIDVYPDEVPARPEHGGYQLGIAMDIFRGRYRESLERPSPIPSGQVVHYQFPLPTANHVFRRGHRIMVQVQSSWFPLYDRNPQTYVDNIFFAKPGDYKKATHRVHRRSYLDLPIAK